MADRGSTTEQLRRDIDKGRAGSKIDYPDPAAAPLGTDDEAAGTPPSPAAVDAARRQETAASPVTPSPDRLDGSAFVYGGIMAAVVGVLLVIALWFSNWY
jgi:hypothetical protein